MGTSASLGFGPSVLQRMLVLFVTARSEQVFGNSRSVGGTGMEKGCWKGQNPAVDLCYSTVTRAPMDFSVEQERLKLILGINKMLQRTKWYPMISHQVLL